MFKEISEQHFERGVKKAPAKVRDAANEAEDYEHLDTIYDTCDVELFETRDSKQACADAGIADEVVKEELAEDLAVARQHAKGTPNLRRSSVTDEPRMDSSSRRGHGDQQPFAPALPASQEKSRNGQHEMRRSGGKATKKKGS